jgi:hypothetical protein
LPVAYFTRVPYDAFRADAPYAHLTAPAQANKPIKNKIKGAVVLMRRSL